MPSPFTAVPADANSQFLLREFTLANGSQIAFYLLNPGEVFAGFGGSSRGLLVRKTASLITRRVDADSGTVSDSERNLRDALAWRWYTDLCASEYSVNRIA